MRTKIFLDSGDVNETKEAKELLGFLDGQTTNPTLIARNPQAQIRLEMGNKFTRDEVYSFYKKVVAQISSLIPDGSVSVEVYADKATSADEMYTQGKEMYGWIPNAHIKLPITGEGLKAADRLVREGIRVNLTLCFSQGQAAAVYAATKGAKKGDVFVSPFVGRLEDRGENGMDLIKNILQMYQEGDGHVEVLTASVRNINHFLDAVEAGSDIITAPLKILKEFAQKVPGTPQSALKPIPFEDIELGEDFTKYDIRHELTDIGIEKFCKDWNNLIKVV